MRLTHKIALASTVCMVGTNASPLLAQAEPSPAVAATDAPTSSQVSDIIVTGSRLANPNFTAPTPVQVLNSETILQRAPANIADVINEIPAFRTSRSATGSGRVADQQSGVQSLIDLRGLGDTRTLVLVNGHRHVGTVASGSFDTNMIPVGLVERVEVVTGGASAAYGSDAVAGVTNFILKNHFEGLNGSFQAGITDHGDGKTYVGNLAGGIAFADGRGHIIAGVDAAQSGNVGNIYERSYGRSEPGLLSVSAAQRAALGLPAQAFSEGVELANVAAGSLITTRTTTNQLYAFDAAGTPFIFNQGTVFGTGTSAVMTGSTANSGYNPNAFFQQQNKNKRIVGYGRAEYELSDAITVFAEANYAHTSLPPTLTSSYLTSFVVPRTSLPTALQALYTGTNVSIGRIMTENGGGNLTSQNLDMQSYTGGAEGEVGTFKWNAYYQHGRTHQDFNTSGLVLSALYSAVYGCNGTATNPNLNTALIAQLNTYQSVTGKTCAAFNPLGVNSSAAALNYIYNNQHQDTYITQDVASASVSGSPFSLWAGDVSVAFGAEYRRDKLRVVSDALGAANVYSQGNFTTFGGRNTVKEGFIEIGVPLLKDMAFAKALDLNGAVRRTDYKISGAVTTWKLGAVWEPLEGIRLRATRSRDIRAPNLNELYFIGGALPTSTTNNIPGTFGFGATSTTNISASGNSALVPEKADTFTGGITALFNTASAGSFRFAVDYYNIRIKGAIARPNSAQTQSICATLIAAGQTTCPGIVFNTIAGTNGITSARNLAVNLNKLKAEGIDFEVGYRVPQILGLPGRFEIRALANHALHLQQFLTLIRADPFETAGTAQGVPRWTGNLTFSYEQDRSGLELQLRGFTKVKYDVLTAFTLAGGTTNGATIVDPSDAGYVNTNANSISNNRFGGRIYANLSGHIAITPNVQLFGVVNNLLDKQPPHYAAIAVTAGSRNLNYDLIGRSYKAGFRFNF